MKDIMRDELGAPKIVDRDTFQAEVDARPIVQWPRLKAGYSDDLGTGRR
jgi:hypothetical protein